MSQTVNSNYCNVVVSQTGNSNSCNSVASQTDNTNSIGVIYTLSGHIGKMVASHAEVARSIPG